MLPLFESKASIVENLIKACWPTFDQFWKVTYDKNIIPKLFSVHKVDQFKLSPDVTDALFEQGEVEQIEECLDTCKDESIKEGIKTIIGFETTLECLVTLYYKWLTQLHRMYSLSTSKLGVNNESSEQLKLPKPKSNINPHKFSKEITQIRLLQLYHLWPVTKLTENLPIYNFENLTPEWGELYIKAYVFKIIKEKVRLF